MNESDLTRSFIEQLLPELDLIVRECDAVNDTNGAGFFATLAAQLKAAQDEMHLLEFCVAFSTTAFAVDVKAYPAALQLRIDGALAIAEGLAFTMTAGDDGAQH